jgi:hypothetical protein
MPLLANSVPPYTGDVPQEASSGLIYLLLKSRRRLSRVGLEACRPRIDVFSSNKCDTALPLF